MTLEPVRQIIMVDGEKDAGSIMEWMNKELKILEDRDRALAKAKPKPRPKPKPQYWLEEMGIEEERGRKDE